MNRREPVRFRDIAGIYVLSLVCIMVPILLVIRDGVPLNWEALVSLLCGIFLGVLLPLLDQYNGCAS